MKKTLLLASVISLMTLSANAQYYQQPRTRTITRTVYQNPYQPQPQNMAPYQQAQYSSPFYFQPYLGVDYNFMISDIDTDDGEGDSFDVEKNLHAFSVSLGARIHDNFGLEAFYEKSTKGKGSGTYYGYKYNTNHELQAFGLDGVIYFPRLANGNLELLGTIGLAYYQEKLSVSFPGLISESAKEDHLGLRFGAGFQYYLNDNVALRLMGHYNNTGIDDAENLYDITAGVRLYF